MSEKSQQQREEELDAAIKEMDAALEAANGTCAARVRGRTTATRRALRKIAELADPVETAEDE